MSIWGKRVDSLFTPRESGELSRGFNAMWKVALVIAVAALGLWLMTQSNANL